MVRVFITGASGFVGSHLVRRLRQDPGYAVAIHVQPTTDLGVFGPDRDGLAVYPCGLELDEVTAALRDAKPDVVIHLASLFLSQHTPAQVRPLVNANVLFGAHLLEAMAQLGIRRFINTGTSWENMSGSVDYRPVCLYAATKRAFQDILLYYVDACGFAAYSFKLFDTYGPGDRRPKLFSLLKRSLDLKEPMPFSPGEQLLDLLHIDDLVPAYVRGIERIREEKAGHREIFLGSGEGVRLKDVVALYEQASGRRAQITWGGRPYREREVMYAQADLTVAKEILGWSPTISLRDGLAQLLEERRD